MNKKIGLLALDLDGTLLKEDGTVSQTDIDAIMAAQEAGIQIVVSTGRPYIGLPFEAMKKSGIRYAITTNGAAIYKVPEKECLYERCIDLEVVERIIPEFLKFDFHFDLFIDGNGYTQRDRMDRIQRLDMTDKMKEYIRTTRHIVDDMVAFLRSNQSKVQKMTLNFYKDSDGSYKDRENVRKYLETVPEITFLCGGFHNWEVTRAGVKKGAGLEFLAEHFGLDISQTMVCGDSENDLNIMQTAGISVAMANSSQEILEIADFITRSNEEDGVAWAINQLILKN